MNRDITIPPEITIVKAAEFGGALRSVTVHSGVTHIEKGTFGSGVRMEFVQPDGVLRLWLEYGWGVYHDDSPLVLRFLHTKDVQEREALFRKLKTFGYKAAIAMYMVQSRPEEEPPIYAAYCKRNARRIAEESILHKDTVNLAWVLETHPLPRAKIEELTETAIKYESQECLVLLLDHKNEAGLYKEKRFNL